jgi:predicted nucleotidyltransferase
MNQLIICKILKCMILCRPHFDPCGMVEQSRLSCRRIYQVTFDKNILKDILLCSSHLQLSHMQPQLHHLLNHKIFCLQNSGINHLIVSKIQKRMILCRLHFDPCGMVEQRRLSCRRIYQVSFCKNILEDNLLCSSHLQLSHMQPQLRHLLNHKIFCLQSSDINRLIWNKKILRGKIPCRLHSPCSMKDQKCNALL